MKKVRIGVIGLKHGMGHAAMALANPRAELTALCDLNEKLLREMQQAMATQHGEAARGVRTFRKMASCGHLGFAEQHESFLGAILDGKPVPCTLADAYEVAS